MVADIILKAGFNISRPPHVETDEEVYRLFSRALGEIGTLDKRIRDGSIIILILTIFIGFDTFLLVLNILRGNTIMWFFELLAVIFVGIACYLNTKQFGVNLDRKEALYTAMIDLSISNITA